MNEDRTDEGREDLKEHLIDSLLELTALSVQVHRNGHWLEDLRDALRFVRQQGPHKPRNRHP